MRVWSPPYSLDTGWQDALPAVCDELIAQLIACLVAAKPAGVEAHCWIAVAFPHTNEKETSMTRQVVAVLSISVYS